MKFELSRVQWSEGRDEYELWSDGGKLHESDPKAVLRGVWRNRRAA